MNALLRFVVACLAVASLHAYGHGSTPDALQPRAATPSANANGRALTLALLDAATQYNTAAPQAKGLLIANLLNIAKARHDELVLAAQADPAEFMRLILPPALLASLPAQAMPFLEQSASVSGTVEVFHVDHVNPADDYYDHVLTTTGNAVYNVHFADTATAPGLSSGTKLTVRGVKVDNHIVVASAADVIVTKAVSVVGGTLGVQKTLVILVSFSNAPTVLPTSVATAQSVVFTTNSNYDYETSYQQTSLSGTVVGTFTIAETNGACNYMTIASQAKQAAVNAGVVLSNYNRYMYVFPSNTCAWWGMGSVGGNPSQAWIHTKYGFSLNVTGHEMGHNLGLYHSHSMDCGATVLATSGCTTSEYGDVFDLMGNTSTGHYNAYHKERLGWLNAGVSPPLTTVAVQSGTATYTISPLENPRDSTPRALKIPRGSSCSGSTNEFFYVETRKNVAGGVVIHKVTDGLVDSSYLLDMTPATSAWSDAALPTGQTFVDTQTGLSITPTSVTTSGAQVNVSFGAASCTRAAPTISYTPTGTVWTSAGAAVTYAVGVTNKDSCGCGATAFDVTGTALPAGWTSTNAHSASISPGATTTTSVVVSTASGTAANFYPLTLVASNAAASTMKASGASTIAISAAIAAGVTTDQATYTLPKSKNSTVNAMITTTVTSNGSPVAGASVSVQVKDPSGKAVTLSGATGSTGVATVTYAMRSRTSAVGTYTATSTATIGGMSASKSVTFTVN